MMNEKNSMRERIGLVNGIPTVSYKPWQSWYLRIPVLRNICSWFIFKRLPKIVMGEPIRGYISKNDIPRIELPKSEQTLLPISITEKDETRLKACAECGEYTENGISMGTGKIFVGEKEVEFAYLCDHHIKSENGVLINCELVRMEWPLPMTK